MDRIQRAVELFQEQKTTEALDLVLQVLTDRAEIQRAEHDRLELRNRGEYEAAIAQINQAIQEAGGGELLGRLLHDRGTTLQGASRFDEALVSLRAAYLVRRAAGDAIGASYSAFQIPMCRNLAGDPHDDLLEEFRQAKNILSQILSEEAAKIEVAHEGNLRQNLAFCLQREGEHESALEMYNEVLSLREQADDQRGYAMTQARIAECLLGLGRLDEAESTAQAALEYFEKIQDQNRIQQLRSTLERIAEKR